MRVLLSWRLWVVLVVVVWALGGGPYAAILHWALLAYLVWRAWPAVWADVRRLFMGVRGSRRSGVSRGVL